MTEILTAIYLEKRRALKKTNRFPVKLRVTFNRKQIYIRTGIFATDEEFLKATTTLNPKGKYKELKDKFDEIVKKADNTINDLPDFSFALFKKRFVRKRGDNGNVFSLYNEIIDQLIAEGRIKTAFAYKNSFSSLKKFYPNEILAFSDVTADFLKNYEIWMLEKNASISTIGIYLRSLRTIVNDAIQRGIIKQESYPFGKRKYIIPSSLNIKKALVKDEIRKIYELELLDGTEEKRWRDMWLFSYLCNGINVKDIARLKYKDIGEESIVFIRAKTENSTRKKLKPIVAALTDDIKKIISKWGNIRIKPDNYVFPFLENGITPFEEYKRIANANDTMNKYMKRIGKKLEITKPVTSMTARHSFATILRREGAPDQFISEKIGHSTIQTTENYFDSFETETTKFWAKKLTDF